MVYLLLWTWTRLRIDAGPEYFQEALDYLDTYQLHDEALVIWKGTDKYLVAEFLDHLDVSYHTDRTSGCFGCLRHLAL